MTMPILYKEGDKYVVRGGPKRKGGMKTLKLMNYDDAYQAYAARVRLYSKERYGQKTHADKIARR